MESKTLRGFCKRCGDDVELVLKAKPFWYHPETSPSQIEYNCITKRIRATAVLSCEQLKIINESKEYSEWGKSKGYGEGAWEFTANPLIEFIEKETKIVAKILRYKQDYITNHKEELNKK